MIKVINAKKGERNKYKEVEKMTNKDQRAGGEKRKKSINTISK